MKKFGYVLLCKKSQKFTVHIVFTNKKRVDRINPRPPSSIKHKCKNISSKVKLSFNPNNTPILSHEKIILGLKANRDNVIEF